MIKHLSTISTAVIFIICIMFMIGCGDDKNKNIKLTVFAAASLTEALMEISARYKTVAPDVTVVYNFDSSGRLQTQIENGAKADIFFSAGQRQMDALAVGGFIDESTRKNLLANRVVLIVPDNGAKEIASFEDAMTGMVKLIALGNADVPVGQYSQEIFEFLNGWDVVSRKASFGSNVKEVLSHVESGSVDCGVVYFTDAATARGVNVVADAPVGSHRPVTYPIALLRDGANSSAAKAFLNFLSSPEAATVFENIGFNVVR